MNVFIPDLFVWSGDVKSPEEVTPLLDECDLLLMETGHHDPAAMCDFVITRRREGMRIGKLLLVHHGRKILDDIVKCELLGEPHLPWYSKPLEARHFTRDGQDTSDIPRAG